ncbi:MAG: adenine phosphoribosyltransferase [Actinobacteria bacterium]|nr:adenine phosphoribosyltransferase [Actinomycetota bacterium]
MSAIPEPFGDAGADVARLIATHLRTVPDYPQPGIQFKDIVPLLADGEAFHAVVKALAGLAAARWPIDAVAGIEARGFVVASALAHELNCGLILVRKAGKLPPPTSRIAYSLEYGSAEVEISSGVAAGRRIYLVDDVLATGGTLQAAAALIGNDGGEVVATGVLLELDALGGRSRLSGGQVQTLLHV